MKLREEFHVARPVADVWTFFEQPERVAACLPGVEEVTVVDPDNVTVRATQRLGPMTATFDAKVKITERVSGELIRFTATGRTVKGALGNVRAGTSVRLAPVDGRTLVSVEGDVTLAGALGSVGQKVVSRQAGKVTAEFARNLDTMLNGGQVTAAPPGPARPRTTASGVPQPAALPSGTGPSGTGPSGTGPSGAEPEADPWPRIAAGLSAVSVLLSLVALVRSRRTRGDHR
jgi:carbon monoxide dehydrogenase subunit G